MKSIVIVQDHMNYRNRVVALKTAHPAVFAVTPWDKPNKHSLSIRCPDEWLPTEPVMPYRKRCWWKADAMGLAAVRAIGERADFYWFIESDVVASQERWRELFRDFENDPSDLVAPMIRTREMKPGAALWEYSPDWMTHFMIMACFRLSHAAVQECIKNAEACRNAFSEATIPSVVHRAGLTLTGMNVRQVHYTTQSMGVNQRAIAPGRDLLSHPVKSNTFDLP